MLNTVLAKIQKQIPRTFVNLVTMFNISQGKFHSNAFLRSLKVYDISMSSEYCRFMWDTLCKHECGCMTDDSTPQDRQMMDVTSVEFNKRIYKVASEWQAKGLSDFTVKVQPFLENNILFIYFKNIVFLTIFYYFINFLFLVSIDPKFSKFLNLYY